MPEERDAPYWMDKLRLKPHPEGGYYRETYRSELAVSPAAQPPEKARSASTAIYFLLAGKQFSAFHRIASDEMWHLYAGGPLLIQVISVTGGHSSISLGGEMFQAVVPAGAWFGACLAEPHGYALVGCTVAPGFDFADFELANRSALLAEYPQHRDLIVQLTKPG